MANVTKIELVDSPVIQPCAIGEPFDYTGLKVKVSYDDETSEIMDVTQKMFNESDLQTTNSVRRSVIAIGRIKAFVEIPILPYAVDRIDVKFSPDLRFIIGEWLDKEKTTVTVYYTDGSSRVITNYKMHPFAPFAAEQESITIRYGRIKTELPIQVISKEALEKELAAKKDDFQFVIPENKPAQVSPSVSQASPIPPVMPVVSAVNPTISPVVNPVVVSPVMQMPPLQVVVVSKPRELKAIIVEVMPKTQSYLIGDVVVNLEGGKVRLLYDDGTSEIEDMNPDGEVRLSAVQPGKGTISYEQHNVPVVFSVDVYAAIIQNIRVKKLPNKIEYEDGEFLDLTGTVLELEYPGGIIREYSGLVLDNYSVSPQTASNGIILAIGGVQFCIPITVRKKTPPPVIIGIKVIHGPDKTTYEAGNVMLDLTGAELQVDWSNGSAERIPINDDMVIPGDFSTPGRILLTVSYKGFEDTFPIFIKEKPPEPVSAAPLTAQPIIQVVAQPEPKPQLQVQQEIPSQPDFYPSSFGFRLFKKKQ